MEQFSMEQHLLVKRIADEIQKVVLGKREIVQLLLISLFSGGHVLIEDVPGVGKTTLAIALAKATGLDCRRAQFTPDVTASDITGFSMYNKSTESFEFREGLVMCNILLADEINRTTPKTQSALLECMEEQSVTVDGVSHPLPKPFFVIATQNELGYIGTFPLPEAQLDRFLMKISMGYPTVQQEINILRDRQLINPLDTVVPVCTKEQIISLVETVRRVEIEANVCKYIVELCAATRTHRSVMLGASPRASLWLMRASQACAFLQRRSYVTPEDVGVMFPFIAEHRIHLKPDAKIRSTTAEDVVTEILKNVKVPFTKE